MTAAPLTHGRDHYAVFDVDETLIRCKSMFSFLNFCYAEVYGPEAGAFAYIEFTENIAAMATSMPREAVNRAFYRVFKGWRRELLAQLARDWFAQELQMGMFHQESLAALRKHQHQGHRIVLLSGSADFILAPLADYLKVEHLLAIHLEQTEFGLLSGEIEGIQTIGAGKRAALEALLASRQATQPAVLHGYGDHESDAPFLSMCDFKTVVLSHPSAPGQAAWCKGWDTIQLPRQRSRKLLSSIAR